MSILNDIYYLTTKNILSFMQDRVQKQYTDETYDCFLNFDFQFDKNNSEEMILDFEDQNHFILQDFDVTSLQKKNRNSQIDIIIEQRDNQSNIIKELLPKVEIFEMLDENNNLNLNSLLEKLNEYEIEMENHFVSYLTDDQYVNLGIYPFEQTYFIQHEDFQDNKTLTIRLEITDYPLGLKIQQLLQNTQKNCGNLQTEQKKQNANKRERQRNIGDVVLQVTKWRQFYGNNKNIQDSLHSQNESSKKTPIFSLQHTALKVGIPKKTLDDYFMQIKLGKRFGFDFNANKYEKIGVLRKYNHQHRKNKD